MHFLLFHAEPLGAFCILNRFPDFLTDFLQLSVALVCNVILLNLNFYSIVIRSTTRHTCRSTEGKTVETLWVEQLKVTYYYK